MSGGASVPGSLSPNIGACGRVCARARGPRASVLTADVGTHSQQMFTEDAWTKYGAFQGTCPAACFMCRGGGLCSSASPGRALRGRENSFWCSQGWTVLSVQSLGLCQRAGRRALSGSCLGKQLVPSPSRAAPRGAGAAAVDAGALPVGQLLPEGRGLDRRREPSPRAYSHQQEPTCALSHCPGIRPDLNFLCS